MDHSFGGLLSSSFSVKETTGITAEAWTQYVVVQHVCRFDRPSRTLQFRALQLPLTQNLSTPETEVSCCFRSFVLKKIITPPTYVP
jgi:hypothetical protein